MEDFKNISYMMSHIFLFLFIYLFNIHRYSKYITAGICFSSFSIVVLADILKLNLFPNSHLCYVIVTIFQIIVTQATGIIISKYINSKVLFMGLSASNYVIAGSLAAAILYYYTKNAFLSLAGSFLIHFAILTVLYKKIRQIWLKQVENISSYTIEKKAEPYLIQTWWELCLIPVFFYCTFTFIAYFPYTLDKNPRNIPGALFSIITMFVSYVVVIHYVESEGKKLDIYWKNVLFEYYIKGLEDQYELIKQSEQNLKILRHDIRHYTRMINALLEQKEYGEIHNITAHIQHVADNNKVQIYCNNLLINTFLDKIMKKAESLSIEINLNTKIAAEIPVNDYEFTAVIANLFDNALFTVKDYEKEQRIIDIKIHCDKNYLLIHMQNPCKEPVIIDNYTGLPKSHKGQNHGFGMKSISAFSNNIKGTIECQWEEGIFSLTMFTKFFNAQN